MAARGIRRTDRVQNPQTVVVPERLQGREARVQAKVPVQVDHVLRGDRDARALLVVQPLAMRHDHVEPIDGAALEEANQNWKVGRLDGGTARGECCTRQEQRIKAQAHQREPTCFDEDTPIDHLGSLRPTVQPYCLWKSGPPNASPTASIRARTGSVISSS